MGAEQQELDQLRQKVIQLEQELALYQALFVCSPVGTFVYKLEDSNDDRSLRLVAANPVVEALANVVPTEIIGKTLDENFRAYVSRAFRKPMHRSSARAHPSAPRVSMAMNG